jgi:hypothetical protein
MDKGKKADVKIIYPPAGFGLLKDAKILQKILVSLGYRVDLCESFSAEARSHTVSSFFQILEKFNLLRLWKKLQKKLCNKPTAIYIYLENLSYQKLFHNAVHVLIPNQEWFNLTSVALLPQIHEVWCKSLLAKNIFSELGVKALYLGFLSGNSNTQSLASFPKVEFISRVGRSSFRGANILVPTWGAHPEWPCLNIVLHKSRRILPCPPNVKYIDEFVNPEDYQKFSSEFKFQIFATETEGFGHTIYEGVVSGATVLLTDAPPMNEVLDDHSVIFINAHYKTHKGLSPRFVVTKEGLEFSVKRALSLTDKECLLMAEHAKCVVSQMETAFITNLTRAMDDVMHQLDHK